MQADGHSLAKGVTMQFDGGLVEETRGMHGLIVIQHSNIDLTSVVDILQQQHPNARCEGKRKEVNRVGCGRAREKKYM